MRHPKAVQFFRTLLGLILLAALVVAAYFILSYIIQYIAKSVVWLISIAEKMDVVIIVAILSAVVTILSMIFGKVIEQRQNTKRYLYSKREEPYRQFIEIVKKIQERTKINREYPESEMISDLFDISKGLTLWGSNRVVKKWMKFRTFSASNDNSTNNLLILEDIIFEIRRDMGHRKGLLKKGDLLKFFINDVDEVLLKPASNRTK